ncbi:unnamed protein product [Parajaminaea phylloscopi]
MVALNPLQPSTSDSGQHHILKPIAATIARASPTSSLSSIVDHLAAAHVRGPFSDPSASSDSSHHSRPPLAFIAYRRPVSTLTAVSRPPVSLFPTGHFAAAIPSAKATVNRPCCRSASATCSRAQSPSRPRLDLPAANNGYSHSSHSVQGLATIALYSYTAITMTTLRIALAARTTRLAAPPTTGSPFSRNGYEGLMFHGNENCEAGARSATTTMVGPNPAMAPTTECWHPDEDDLLHLDAPSELCHGGCPPSQPLNGEYRPPSASSMANTAPCSDSIGTEIWPH